MKEFAVTFVVSSDSSEKLHAARQLAASKVRPDSVFTDVGRAKDRVVVQHRRVGDYFRSIHVVDGGPASFSLVFVPHGNADRNWKDVAIDILASIRGSGVTVCGRKPGALH